MVIYADGSVLCTTTVTAIDSVIVSMSGALTVTTTVSGAIYKYRVLKSGLAQQKSSFFKFSDKLYFKNGAQYIQYDGNTNLLGSDGDCEDTSKWTGANATLALDATNKVFGSYGIKVTQQIAAYSFVYKTLSDFIPDLNKYYLVTAYLKNGNVTNIKIQKDSTGGGTPVFSDVVTSTTGFTRVGFVLKPSDMNKNNLLQIYTTGTATNQYAYVDAIAVNEITSAEYNLGAVAIMYKYPYLLGATNVAPYIPTVSINRTYSGGGNLNEDYNRLGAGFINAFITDGSHTVFPLSDTNLDATAIVGSNDGGLTWTMVETTNFTVNRVTGTVTYTTAPATGTNTFRIKAYKTVQADIDSIMNCVYTQPFGGQNDNRVFFAGNGTGYYYWSGITNAGMDATYVPWKNYNIIGLPDENITGFAKHKDVLCIFKPREIYGETYTWNGTTGVFSTFPIESSVGCDCPDSLQSINNNLVWLTSYNGAYTLVSTVVGNQRNVFPISRNINPWLMAETNLTSATSVNFDGKYWLCVNDKVYLWDYTTTPYMDTGDPDESARRLAWWYFDSINSGGFIVSDSLMYVDRATGKINKFHPKDNKQFYDFGGMINALWRDPIRELGGGTHEFSVLRGWVTVRGDTSTSYKVTYITSDDFNGDPATEDIKVGSFTWTNFSWTNFTWDVVGPLYDWALSPYEKNIRYFGAEFTNTQAGSDMNISALRWQYKIGKMIR